ncbi:DUF4178 domain-containing protein [Sphingomonas sp.]|uniref:DUF4178 domain-containing protein n=1 Tax=Sphingomonas sp. TaxID=28214 RepID=UPI003B005976
MLDTNCPNCGAALRFRSAELAVKVCDYCRSTIVRKGEVLENVGKAAEVPGDVSPLQVGVRGRDLTTAFEIVGRVRWGYADGAWNEWCLLYADGSYGWLGEASGRLMLLREAETSMFSGEAVARLSTGGTVEPGMVAAIGGLDYSVSDVQQVGCIGSEGELPYPTPIGTKAVSVDLQRPDGRTASLQTDGGQVSAYAGRYVTLADIAATGLRQFDGWPMPRFAA